MKIKIISDSTCDLSKELIEQNDITIMPLTVVKGGEQFHDGVDIDPAEIFAHVADGGDLCSTAALNVGEYTEVFSRFADQYDGIVHINISSEFSSCHQNARLAAAEFENIRVIDSRNLSTGHGLVVLKAVELAKTCESLDELEASFLLSRLDYMVKGGRCSAVVALGANLLGLKPCIEVKNGKMSVVKKYRGSFDKCLANYVKDRLSGRDDLDKGTLFITRTTVSDECLSAVENAVAQYNDFNDTYWTTAGCTVSCHCGPGTLGVLFVRK